jgi:hypothetical protein
MRMKKGDNYLDKYRVDCYPIRCPDGTCGIECTGKFGTERGDPFNSCE